MLIKIKGNIEESLGNDYAIIALHMEGKDFDQPSLWRMLRQAFLYETNITGLYTPQGSGGFTGKKHYLALLISDNEKISFGKWSFRNWDLVINQYGISNYDIIDNLSVVDQKLYKYEQSEIDVNQGLNYNFRVLNDDQISFYYRRVKEG